MCGQPQVLRLLGHFSELGTLALMPMTLSSRRGQEQTSAQHPRNRCPSTQVAQVDYKMVLSLVLKTAFEESWFISRF